jgi:ADP-ribosyl-[dinitrogen reductase] hydrolase
MKIEVTSKLHHKYCGALFGLACGDALGTTNASKPPGSFERLTDMVGGGPFNLQPGQWSDGTSMALCLGESLVNCRGFDANDQMQGYLRWWQDGHMSARGYCFDISKTVGTALTTYKKTGNPFAGSVDASAASIGSLIRLAPVPLAYRMYPELAIYYAGGSSRTTHGAAAAVDACRYYAALILGALDDRAKAELLSPNFYQGALSPEIREIADGSFKDKNPPAIAGTDYVARALEASLWAFYRSSSFEKGALLAANLGDNSDTTASVFGQLAGCYYGSEAIPQHWLNKLAMRETISTLADNLLALSESLAPTSASR